MYLFKSIIISTIIYLFYKLFLQKETFFQSIRWYFVIGMVISLLLPLFIIPIYVEVSPIIEPALVEVTAIQELPDYTGIAIESEIVKPIDWQFWLQSVYLIGIAFFLLKFMMELFSLMRLISISKKYKKEHYYLVETNAEVSPFSFFNYIVYNKKDFKESELKNIIEHEKVHVNQKHSIDIILVQLFVILQWFNPFVWLYKKDLQQNLEYIADYFAQNKAETHKKYQYLLLKTSIKNNPFALSNNFFNSQLKKRIMMLQKSQTKKLNQLKYVLLLPLIALFMYSFNTKEVYVQKETNKSQDKGYLESSNDDSLVFIQPINKKELTGMASGYGMRINPFTKKRTMHYGMDFSAKTGVIVFASERGEVVKAAYDKNYGNVVYINHENGFQTRYAHLSEISVEIGTQVNQGDIIGKIGSTGKSVAPHLHFEVLKDGKNVNPMDYLIPFVKKEHDKKSQEQNVSNYKSLQHLLTYGSFFITKTIPTKEEILLWKNKDNFHIWIDDVSIDNKNISNYNNTDFSYYSVVVRGKEEGDFDVYLMSNKYFDNYIEKRDKEINPKTLKYIKIGVSTTDEEFKSINNLNKKYGVKLMVEKIVRNSQDKIIDLEISIIDKDENVSGYMSDWQINKPIADFFIVYNKDRSIYKILSKRPVEYTKNNVMNNINVKTKNNKKQSGWIQYKKTTYYYMLENNKLEFRNRYGDKVENELATELLIYFNNKYESNYKLKTSTKNFIHYKNEMYFYDTVNNQVVFYDKFGENVDVNLANELLNIYKTDRPVKYAKNKKNKVKLDQFTITINKENTTKDLNEVVDILKKFDAKTEFSNIKRNSKGNIIAIDLKVNWKKYHSVSVFEINDIGKEIKPLKIILDEKLKKVIIKHLKVIANNKANTIIEVKIDKQTTTEQLEAYKKLFLDFGYQLQFSEIERSQKVLTKIKIESTKTTEHDVFIELNQNGIDTIKIIYNESQKSLKITK